MGRSAPTTTGQPRRRSPFRRTSGISRQRRPTGAPPPVPYHLGMSGRIWLALFACLVGALIAGALSATWVKLGDNIDTAILRALAEVRVSWLDRVARGVKSAGSGWAYTVVAFTTLALLMIFRRWRHLWVLLLGVVVFQIVGLLLYQAAARPRPYSVPIIGAWSGFSLPSPPVAVFTALIVGIAFTLVVPGRPRWWFGIVGGGLVALLGLARAYLAVDHPSDIAFGVILGLAIPGLAFRLFTPNEVFPVAYRKGSTAHLDVTGARGKGIRQAIRDQLGLTVIEVKPVGLAGSGGSTPLRLKVAGDPDTYVFAKLYAKNHVRADRWYKIWRTILYGRLEDEASFQTVRRFVEYEDYTARLLYDLGIPTAEPYGVVEITPEREYMLVTEFFDGAVEIAEADVDDSIIDQGLQLIRRLWDAGIAHRDIKPANLMVRDGKLLLIDVFFAQVRPSPWREAVDLANMMLVLAVRTDPDRVYRRALQYFTPEDLSEAFAATRGVASPTQLRAFMKQDGRDLLGRFRELAPPRPPIAIQRWSVKRILMAVGMFGAIGLAVYAGAGLFFPAQNLDVSVPPTCGTGNSMILMAQGVPSATRLPCISSLPTGWNIVSVHIRTGEATMELWPGQKGASVTITLTPRCDVSGAQRIPSDEAGTARYEHPVSLRPTYVDVRSYVFRGGCARYLFSLPAGTQSSTVFGADAALSFMERSTLVAHVRENEDLTLCGAGAPCRI